jgi:hypothetical protein
MFASPPNYRERALAVSCINEDDGCFRLIILVVKWAVRWAFTVAHIGEELKMSKAMCWGSRYVPITAALSGTFISCALAIACFYGLWSKEIIYPFGNHSEEVVTVLCTATIATLVSSWAIWIGTSRKRSLAMTLLRTGLPIQASLTLYAMVGLRMAITWNSSHVNLVFPSTFFSEYNWLTFIFEVAPVTSIGASLLLYGSFSGPAVARGAD